jgi:uncharacterized NAD(P)/FAD-binding protein YdhS
VHIVMKRIVIIGGGISGHLVLINLLRLRPAEAMEITLVEKVNGEKLGLAFSVEEDIFLLNVPACNMSAFFDEEDHFVNWLRSIGYDFTSVSYVPRKIYREYIRQVLAEMMQSASHRHKTSVICDEAVDIDNVGKIIFLKSGLSLSFDKAILAIGQIYSKELPLESRLYKGSKFYHHSPWGENIYNRVNPEEKVLILGTGLTMIDTFLVLSKYGHQGNITAVSRHGLIPAENSLAGSRPDLECELLREDSLIGILKIVRRHILMALIKGSEWQTVIDSMRPYTHKIWMRLSDSERRSFLNHLRHYWDSARHRVPPSTYAFIRKTMAEGRLVVNAGRIMKIECVTEQGLEVTWRSRESGGLRNLSVGRVINCMGPETNYKCIDTPLIRNLIFRGILVSDDFNLGVCTLPDGRLVASDGSASDDLITLGAPLKGTLWETTAVPEIRLQAYKLAKRI